MKSKLSVVFVFLFVLLFFQSLSYGGGKEVAANTVKRELNNSEWGYSYVSGPIVSVSDEVNKKVIENIFKMRKLSFNNNILNVTGLCSYEYIAEKKTPISYWYSNKTVELYKNFFSKYNVKLNDYIYNVSPVNPDETCEYPFSDFIYIDNKMVFIYDGYAIFYSRMDSSKSLSNAKKNNFCKHTEQSIESVYENGDITECFYNGVNIVEAYAIFRNSSIEGSDGFYLSEKLNVMKNITVKCDKDCMEVKYIWINKNKLKIIIEFSGGTTEFYFNENINGTKVITKSYPD
ncbi:hypothetical protein [Photorhabdus akhurstii]|uniref:hypothetical protein n=1 Tax=Photorhabdus akhurstii TaxID=171438 RepID=UPI001BD49C57|nr:hypothetical protein [Photorhabdus akhurstii]MBS9427747.1 hypothetical protein [Photorhabdus akhurstii]